MRSSFQRDTIHKVVQSTKCHPTADWVYLKARKIVPHISLGTVYRNLKQLSNNGLIRTIQDGSVTKYDGNMKAHHHLKCSQCGSITDIDLHNLNLNEKIKEKFDFEPIDFEVTIIGKCNKHT